MALGDLLHLLRAPPVDQNFCLEPFVCPGPTRAEIIGPQIVWVHKVGHHQEWNPQTLDAIDPQAVPSWEGSDDQGSDHVRSLAAMELDCWDLPPPPASLHWPQAGAAGAPALRVSLLARLPETAVRAVAQAAGLPNWDWVAPGCANSLT